MGDCLTKRSDKVLALDCNRISESIRSTFSPTILSERRVEEMLTSVNRMVLSEWDDCAKQANPVSSIITSKPDEGILFHMFKSRFMTQYMKRQHINKAIRKKVE
jgi:hypothetical protein